MSTVVYGFSKGDRSGRVQWLLEEMGQSYEFQKLNYRDGDHEKPAYLAMNPMGMSPTFKSGDTVLFESCAICTYLADQNPAAKLSPEVDSKERAEYLKWMFFTAATLDPKINESVYAGMAKDEAWQADVKKDIAEICDVYEKHLAGRDTLLPSGFSAADASTAVALFWVDDDVLATRPAIRAYLEKMKARPAALRSGVFAS